MTTTLLDRTTARPQARQRPGLLLATVLAGQFMAILDVSIVNVAAPTLRHDLHASGSGLQLVIAGYTIAYAMLLITGARLGDLWGVRRSFTTGLALFTVASLACGLAPATGWLIAFRLAQGAGAALMVPQVLSVIQRHFDGAGRARALSLYSTVLAGGAVVGQVLGGLIVSADLFGASWRPVFLVNVPVGVVLLLAAWRLMPAGGGTRSRRLDLLGVLTLTPAVFLLVVPLVLGHELNWPLWGWLCLLGSAVAFAGFVAVQRRSADPLVPGKLLKHPGVVTAATGILVMMAAYGGFLFSQALHLQAGQGFSALKAGIAFVPGALAFAVGSLNWRRIPARLHRWMIPVGLVLAGTGLVLMGPTGGTGLFGVGSTIAIVAIGLGLGVSFSPTLAFGLRHVPPAEAADAAGLLAMVTQLGQVIGVAAFGSLYLAQVRTHVSTDALTYTGVGLAAAALAAAAVISRLRMG
jgi:MFS family permease